MSHRVTPPNVQAFVGGTAILPDRLLPDATLLCEAGKIRAVGVATEIQVPPSTEHIDCSGQFLSPGFIDMHVHGGRGADFMDGTLAAFQTVCTAHAQHGTTTIFPTTTTGTPQQILAMLAAFQAARKSPIGSLLGGVHLYGPYFAEDKVGCHLVSGRREPQSSEYESYFDSDCVRIATCAAELPGAIEFYQAAAERGCLITCGHSNASWAEMQIAFEAGMRHVDHFWCAMSSVPSLRQRLGVPMQASMAEFVLLNPLMSTEVIADGFHLSPELLEFAFRMLPERLCLVTDANRALDMPAGEYRFGHCDDGSWLYSDGRVGWATDRRSLASSVVGMDTMVRTMLTHTTATLPEVIRMASLTPAERTCIAAETGSLEVGKWADLLLLSDDLHVRQVYSRGVLV
ncbi:MAG: amidohydrolase family protein [Pirellulaceae bacterium]